MHALFADPVDPDTQHCLLDAEDSEPHKKLSWILNTIHLLSLISAIWQYYVFLSSLCSIVYVVCICRILNISKGFLMKFNAYKIECYHGFYFFVFYITAICIVYLHNSYFFAELSHEIWHLHDPRVYSRYSLGNLLI